MSSAYRSVFEEFELLVAADFSLLHEGPGQSTNFKFSRNDWGSVRLVDKHQWSKEPACGRRLNSQVNVLGVGGDGHTLNIVGRRAIVFGGCTEQDDKPTILNEAYSIDLSSNEYKWTKLDPEERNVPQPRWRHTGNTISFILDLEPETPVWSDVSANGVAPSPRSYHTASLCEKRIYVFGGYGGHGERRQHFNDMHIFDVETKTWLGEENGIQVEREGGVRTEGSLPSPRCNHTTNVIEKTFLIVTGGRDSNQYFDDTHIFCTATLTWTQIRNIANPTAPTRLCSHLAEGVQSVPSYYLFVFGGQTSHEKSRTDWSYRAKVDVLDCKSMTWLSSQGAVQGTGPTAREDAAWAFDPKTAKILMFGGWSNDWLNDFYTLDVSGIVGPPYAVQGLEPDEGPITGKTEVIVHGLDFSKGKITIKFTDGRNEEVSEKAEYISPTQLRCLSPDWSKFGPGEVLVRVSIGGEGFTVNRVKWTYYVNTKPQKCIAYGPGIFDKGGVWGFPAVFKIQAKDTTGRNRSSGGEAEFWRVSVKYGEKKLKTKLIDNKDGTYDVSYIPLGQGGVEIEVAYDDPVQGSVIPIRGSPWKSYFENPWVKCKVQGQPPRFCEGMQATTLMKKIVYYGGNSSVNIFDSEQLKWETPEVEGKAPDDRIFHSITTLDNEKMVVFGGQKPPSEDASAESQPPADFSSVHVLVCEKGGWKWAPSTDISGEKPGILAKHTACLIPLGKKVLVFGGVDKEGNRYDDLRILSAQNINKMDWLHIAKTSDATSNAGWERASSALDVKTDDGQTKYESNYGQVASQDKNTNAEDANGATVQETSHEENEDGEADAAETSESEEDVNLHMAAPGKRLGSGIAFLEGKVYLFGGDACHDDGTNLFTNVMSIGTIRGNNPKNFEKGDQIVWENCEVSGDVPKARSDFIMTVLDGKIVVYGGYDRQGKMLDDMYQLDPDTQEWTCVYSSDATTAPLKPISSFVQKRLFSVSGKKDLEDVRVLEFGRIAEQSNFFAKMSSRVVEELEKLFNWEKIALADLNVDPNSGSTEDKQRDLLLKAEPNIELQLDVLKDAIGLISKNGINVDKNEAQMNEVMEQWASLKKQAPIAKELGKKVQAREALKIKNNIQNYENKVKTYQFEFRKKPLFEFKTGVATAYQDIFKTRSELLKLEDEYSDLANFARIFEFPEMMEPTRALQDQCHSELRQMVQMWHMVDMIEYQVGQWKTTLWNDIECESMEEGAKTLFKQLRSQDKFVKGTDCFTICEQNVKNFLSTIPLVSDLRHPSMRDRHWNMLMDLTGVKFQIDDSFKLDDLLRLELHKFEDDVGEIVNRAQKEEKMEQALKKIGSTWVGLEFNFIQHKDTDVQLVKLSEEDFETLEDHQLQIQNMMGSRYLSTFEDEAICQGAQVQTVSSWQKTLSAVSDVVSIMNEIQRTWAYLETLFIGSDEVKKELPEDTERFAGIDNDVRKVLADFFQVKLAAKACTVDGVLKLLEETQYKLELCEKSLANYLEQKRRIFPRFYFVHGTRFEL
eukprot:755854-Hanusia_phi.AAC.7